MEQNRFLLIRDVDETGVSGTGIVAMGFQFPTGRVVIEWLVKPFALGIFSSLQELIEVHGHEGKTWVKFISE
ncbi:MAG TPA: hypothetical protein VEA58_02270 [Anaerovoracaceae bacterium]|nr:hypothetical protein [Anaerovoracaceae bacterium]